MTTDTQRTHTFIYTYILIYVCKMHLDFIKGHWSEMTNFFIIFILLFYLIYCLINSIFEKKIKKRGYNKTRKPNKKKRRQKKAEREICYKNCGSKWKSGQFIGSPTKTDGKVTVDERAAGSLRRERKTIAVEEANCTKAEQTSKEYEVHYNI